MRFKLIESFVEAYLDPEEKFYDYRTGTVTGNNIFDTSTTGVSGYDQFLNKKEAEYMKNAKNQIGTIEYLSPLEYYEICSKPPIFNSSVEKLKKERARDVEVIEHLKQVLTKYKKQFPMTYINYAEGGQEGLHRMMVAGELYGWDTKFPVLIVKWADEERHRRDEEAARKKDIYNKLHKAVLESLRYKFTDLEDFKTQLQWDLDRQFELDDNVSFTLTQKDNELTLTVLEVEYSFDINDIQFRADKSSEEEPEELDDEDIDDWLAKYLGDNWEEEFPEAKNKILGESLENINKEDVIKVLEECNNCIYWDTAMIMDVCCTKLYHDYNIDALYHGRTIYVNNEKLAIIQIAKEGPHMIAMIGYKLFI